jgi:hypothetical protein
MASSNAPPNEVETSGSNAVASPLKNVTCARHLADAIKRMAVTNAGARYDRLAVFSCPLSLYSGGGLGWGSQDFQFAKDRQFGRRVKNPHPGPPPEYREREKREIADLVTGPTNAATLVLMLKHCIFDVTKRTLEN